MCSDRFTVRIQYVAITMQLNCSELAIASHVYYNNNNYNAVVIYDYKLILYTINGIAIQVASQLVVDSYVCMSFNRQKQLQPPASYNITNIKCDPALEIRMAYGHKTQAPVQIIRIIIVISNLMKMCRLHDIPNSLVHKQLYVASQ